MDDETINNLLTNARRVLKTGIEHIPLFMVQGLMPFQEHAEFYSGVISTIIYAMSKFDFSSRITDCMIFACCYRILQWAGEVSPMRSDRVFIARSCSRHARNYALMKKSPRVLKLSINVLRGAYFAYGFMYKKFTGPIKNWCRKKRYSTAYSIINH